MKASRYSILPLLLFTLAFAGRQLAQAQQYPLEVTVTLIPPYSPLLSDWEAHPERVQLIVRNTDAGNRYEFRLSGSIENADKSIRVRSKDNVDMRMFEIEAGAVKTLSGLDWNLFNQNQVEGSGVDRDMVARTGRLPEGEYTLCAQALDYTSRNPLSAPPPAGCASMWLYFGEVPVPMSPVCGDPVEVLLPQTLLFQWSTPVAGIPPEELGNLRYELLLVPVPAGKIPETAIESPGDPPFFTARDLTSALYTYTAADPLLESGTTYAWRVRVYDLNERVAFRNGGKSEVCSFVFKAVDPVCMTLLAMTPANNETIRSGLPRFSVSVDRSIRMEAVTGGRLQIFDVVNNQNQTPGRTNDPNDRVLFEASFSGNSTSNIVKRNETGKADVLELRFVNYPGSDYTFQPLKGKYYRWSFILSYEPSNIRADRAICQYSSAASDNVYFKTEATEGVLPDECTADCMAAAPTPAEPGPQTLKKGDELQIGRFTLLLDNVSGGTGNLSGDGEIQVRFLNEIRVPVAFNGL
jgi:TANFOR domain-containing protein